MHEGKLLPIIHGRTVMTTFTNRLMEQAMRYGLSREGTEIIRRMGSRNLSLSLNPKPKHFRVLHVWNDTWERALEIAGLQGNEGDDKIIEKLIEMATTPR